MSDLSISTSLTESKSGKSIAIRCRCCGEITITDEIRTAQIKSYYLKGIPVGSTLEEDAKSIIVCRLCGFPSTLPSKLSCVSWSEYEFAFTSEQLIEQTNPNVRDWPNLSIASLGLEKIHTIPRPVLARLYGLTPPSYPLGYMTVLLLFLSIGVAAVLYALAGPTMAIGFSVVTLMIGTKIPSHAEFLPHVQTVFATAAGLLVGFCVLFGEDESRFAAIWVLTILLPLAAIWWFIYSRIRDHDMADYHFYPVVRFCDETGYTLDDMIGYAPKTRQFGPATRILRLISAEFDDVS